MTCSACQAPLILEPTIRRLACSTCRREPAVCPCQPTISAHVPAWIARKNAGLLRAKVLAA